MVPVCVQIEDPCLWATRHQLDDGWFGERSLEWKDINRVKKYFSLIPLAIF